MESQKRKLLVNLGYPNRLYVPWIKIKKCRETLETNPRSGQPRKTTERDNRQLSKISKGDAPLTILQITSECNKYSEVKIFDSTMKRHLHDNNLFVLV